MRNWIEREAERKENKRVAKESVGVFFKLEINNTEMVLITQWKSFEESTEM